jgi:hypothetical protein
VYSTCLFCRAALGTNQSVEHLPVGRRIAFDAVRGRLWVVCVRCGRWNLTPFDERWEAVEECERRFAATRVRASSDNIGLARLDDGLEVIRIGRPLRPEFAAWRYGSRFLRRNRRYLLYGIGTLGRYGLIGLGPVLAVAFAPAAVVAWAGLSALTALGLARRPALRVGFEGGEELRLNLRHIRAARLLPDDAAPDGWALEVAHLAEPSSLAANRIRRRFYQSTVVLTGMDARLVAARLLPRVNPLGGSAATVTEAVRWLEAAGGSQRVFHTVARARLVRPPLDTLKTSLSSMHPEIRMALEMALHEEEERRAFAGELSVLEWMWRSEERLAAIADRLGIPETIERRLGELTRSRGDTGPVGAMGHAGYLPAKGDRTMPEDSTRTGR